MTEAEKVLWERLRNKQLCNVKARRQYGFGPYVLDFYIPQANLAVEVDGKIHLKKEQRHKDKSKDAFLKRNEIEIIRIKNQEVFKNIDSVMSKLETIVRERVKI